MFFTKYLWQDGEKKLVQFSFREKKIKCFWKKKLKKKITYDKKYFKKKTNHTFFLLNVYKNSNAYDCIYPREWEKQTVRPFTKVIQYENTGMLRWQNSSGSRAELQDKFWLIREVYNSCRKHRDVCIVSVHVTN